MIAEATGRDIRFEELTPEAARAELTAFMPEVVVDMVLGHLADSVGEIHHSCCRLWRS